MTRWRPRVTIERLRTLVLIGGGLLIAAIVIFLAAGQWTRRFLTKDLPHRLGVDVEQSADGVNYTQTRKGKTIFKIHAAKALQMKGSGKMELHDVRIDLYGDDGNRADTIAGSEFEYDQSAGTATAAGAVEITLMRPGVKPAIAALKPGASKSKLAGETGDAHSANGSARAEVAEIPDNQIHVKTSGLVFNQKTGVAATAEHVDFALKQGTGSSLGAVYDSTKGKLVLDRDVVLHAERGVGQAGAGQARMGLQANLGKGPITVVATHAEFERSEMECQLTQARADYTGGTAEAANALLHFREDGSVLRLDGSGGVDLKTVTGNHVTAPTGSLNFDEMNHPREGLLSGGATIDSLRSAGSDGSGSRQVHGSSPTARMIFDRNGELSLAHFERGVQFVSAQQGTRAKGLAVQIHRSWQSQSADVVFALTSGSRTTAGEAGSLQEKPDSRVAARTIRGFGGVVVNSESTSGGVHTPSRFAADTVVADLAPGGAMSALTGTGHASVDERTTTGVHQASSADQMDVKFVPADAAGLGAKRRDGASEIASLVEIGHVVMVQDPAPAPAPKPVSGPALGLASRLGGNPAAQNSVARSSIRATANRADYDGTNEILHLTGSPRVVDGPLDMTANRIDFAKASGDGFAHGDVRASWIGNGVGTSLLALSGANAKPSNGPVHAVAAEAELHEATEEVILKGTSEAGNLPRLWQAANSVIAPVITLNRLKETLTANSYGAANPVRTVLVTNGALTGAKPDAGHDVGEKKRFDSPSTIRVRSGDLRYSEGQRLAVFHSGSGGSVTAETIGKDGLMRVVSDEAEVLLPPVTKRAGPGTSIGISTGTSPGISAGNGPTSNPGGAGASSSRGPAWGLGSANPGIDRLTAQGRVSVDWRDRRGTGEKLVYRGEDDSYTLTGTSAVPPRITDALQGTVTGSALIFHGGDDSVTVEGDGGKTVTETRSKK